MGAVDATRRGKSRVREEDRTDLQALRVRSGEGGSGSAPDGTHPTAPYSDRARSDTGSQGHSREFYRWLSANDIRNGEQAARAAGSLERQDGSWGHRGLRRLATTS